MSERGRIPRRDWRQELPAVYLLASRFLANGRDYLALVRRALEGGVDLLQMREKGIGRREALELGAALRGLAEARGIPFLVNDDPLLARELGADGVHLGQEDAPIEEARRVLGEGALVGLSTHDRAQVDEAWRRGSDMIGVGPVFATSTKDAGPPVGVALVRYAAERHPDRPAFPIGGIGPGNAERIRTAGCRRAAVSSAVLGAPDPAEAVAALRVVLGAP